MTASAGTPTRPRTAPSISLVVPLYNEEDRVAEHGSELADFVAGYGPESELVFVDDGSTDATVGVVEKLVTSRPDVVIRLLTRPHAGKGAALQAGLTQAKAEYGAFCDVDLSTPLDQLDLIVRAATMGPILAIGSRDSATSRLVRPQRRMRQMLGRTYNRLVQLTVAPGIVDTQCGAKAAHAALWKAILPWCHEEGFAWDVEAVGVARRLGISVREVAIEWSHDDRSRVRVGRDGVKMVLAVARIARRGRAMPATTAMATQRSRVFDDVQAMSLIESDTEHWWFRCKGAHVSRALRQIPPRRGTRLMDLGSGAGGVTSILGWRPDRLIGIEGSVTLCRRARERHALLTVAGALEALPLPTGVAGVVTLLDVIEHLEDPGVALREALRILEDDGLLVVNVPAHQWLWSGADELLGHVRRYSRPAVRSQLESAGFRVVWISHIFSWLLPAVWWQRRLQTDAHKQLGLDADSVWVDRAALGLNKMERFVVRFLALPFGTSILCVATKPANDAGTRTAGRASS